MTTHWKISRPRDTHWRAASCAEIGCSKYLLGWETVLPADDVSNLAYIRRSGLRFREESDGAVVRFIFEPGQECFHGQANKHRTQLERDPIFKRDNTELEPIQFLDDMNDHLYRIGGRNG